MKNLEKLKQKSIVIKLKNIYLDDPVDRLRGVNIVKTLQSRGWNIALFNNQKKIDLIIYLDDYNLYERLIYEHIDAKRYIVDIQDNHLVRQNPASAFIKRTHKHSMVKRISSELSKGFFPLLYKIIVKRLWSKLYQYSLQNADALVCSSYALERVYKECNNHVVTIADAVAFYKKESVKKNDTISICWVGTQNNIAYLQLIDDAIYHLQQKYKIDFTIITANTIFDDPKLSSILENFKMHYTFVPWKEDNVIRELQKCHIAVAPLPPHTQKSTNKILTYMMADLPVVASGASDYQKLLSHYPNSFVFLEENHTKEWIDHLEELIIDPKFGDALLLHAKDVLEAHSLEHIAEQYEALFLELFTESRL